jgi:ABC-type lipoprotein release transport system permease subunit
MFVALALAMFAWQANDLVGVLAESPVPAVTGLVIVASLLALAVLVFAGKKIPAEKRLVTYAIAGLPALPLTGLAGAVLSLAGRGSGNQRSTWESVLAIGAIATMCVGLPIGIGLSFMGGSFGLTAGWAGIQAEFFVIVDYFLVRALLHFFASGASAFISLRYLRRRVMSILSVVGIMLGVLVLIVVNSVMTGFQQDFREQVRGSLSHVLVRFDSQSIRSGLDRSESRRAEWQAYIAAIESKPSMAEDWTAMEEEALENYRKLPDDTDGDILSDNLRGQPPIPEDESEPEISGDTLTADEQAFMKRVRTGEFNSADEAACLADAKGRITPKAFYLEQFASTAERRKAEDAVTESWFWPLFSARMSHDFEIAERALKRHRSNEGELDVVGVSPRVSTQTFITPRGGRQKELPIAELIGVDVQSETEISNLGQYVASAEIQSFREQYTLRPLRNLLGAILGWETQASLDATEAKPAFLYLEEGKPLGLRSMPSDLTRDLKRRRFMTGVGKIRWSEFDNVEFWEFTPGQAIYNIVKSAIKDAERADTYPELKEVLRSCVEDVLAIVRPRAESEATDREGQMVRKGCRIFLHNYLTTIDLIDRERRYIYGKAVSEYLTELLEAPDEETNLLPKEREIVIGLRTAINELFKASKDRLLDSEISELERAEAFEKLLNDILSAASDAQTKILSAGIDESIAIESAISPLEYDITGARNSPMLDVMLESRSVLPAIYLLEVIDDGIKASTARHEAYQRVLPLRTSLASGESADDYLKRAIKSGQRPSPKRPGIILGDALAQSPALDGVQVGDSIAVTIPRIFYDENMRLVPRTTEVWFEVTGFFRSGLFEDNLGKMYCDFDELAKVLADSEVRFYLGAKLKDYTPYEGTVAGAQLKDDLRSELRSVGLNAYVTVWEDEKRTLLDAVNREKMILGLIVSMIILLAGGGIVIVIYQLVNEKVRDIGILKALGQSPWGIRSLFMFNALFIGVFGAIIGSLAGIGVSEYLNEIEDLIDQLTGIRLFPEDIYFLTYIPTIKGVELLKLAMNIAMPVVMFSFFCGIFPAMLAARKDPVEALHHE